MMEICNYFLHTVTESQEDTLMYASCAKDTSTLADLLSRENVHVDYLWGGERTALVCAATCNNLTAVRMLLDAGADPNIATIKKHRTPLMQAAQNDSIDMVQLLLQHHAKVNVFDCNRYTAILLAAKHGSSELMHILCKAGADTNVSNVCAQTPLMCAAQNGSVLSLQLLLQNNACKNTTDDVGMTALHHAVTRGQFDAARELLSAEADTAIVCKCGQSALAIAVKTWNVSLIKLLLRYEDNICSTLDKYKKIVRKCGHDLDKFQKLVCKYRIRNVKALHN